MYLYGASGHSRVIIDTLKACGIRIEGIFDDNHQVLSIMGFPVLHHWDGESPIILAIGDNDTRKRLSQKLDCEFGKAIHPTAIISATSEVGEGSVVMPGAVINAGTHIGRHCIINTGAVVEHDCRIEDYAHISPSSTLCGNVHIGEGTWVGAGSTVIQGINIGRWVVIGAGAVVINDIPDNAVAVGSPARIIRFTNNSK